MSKDFQLSEAFKVQSAVQLLVTPPASPSTTEEDSDDYTEDKENVSPCESPVKSASSSGHVLSPSVSRAPLADISQRFCLPRPKRADVSEGNVINRIEKTAALQSDGRNRLTELRWSGEADQFQVVPLGPDRLSA